MDNKNIIAVDREKLKSDNSFVLGKPGRGVGFSLKQHIFEKTLEEFGSAMVLDPKEEFLHLSENNPSDINQPINPFDIRCDDETEEEENK